MNKKTQILALAGVCVILVLSACNPASPEALPAMSTFTPTPTEKNIAPEPITPTPTLGSPVSPGSNSTVTPPRPSSGKLEMRTPDLLNPANEDCVNYFPFTVNDETDPPTITGEGRIDCHFQSVTQACILHAVMDYTVVVQGEIKLGENGEERLLVELTLDGSLSNYMSDYPPDAVVLFTEANPFVWKEKGPMSLNFEFVDGAKTTVIQTNPLPADTTSSGEINRIFILHLTN